MTITFKPAARENVGLWINLIGGTGSGKTYTAMRLAAGIAGDKPFCVIDTENRRALHYADKFKFDHAELHAPFRPDNYAEAIVAADKAGYPVIVVDSGSHVWSGDGGMLDWFDDEYERLGGKDNVKMLAWVKPKKSHKQMVSKMLQTRAHIILCLRAEEKIEMVKDKQTSKMVVQPKASLTGLGGWIPLCDKALPFEATVSFLFIADQPGIPHPIKLPEQLKSIFPLDKVVDESSGERLAAWAKGGISSPPGTVITGITVKDDGSKPIVQLNDCITSDQGIYIDDLLAKHPKMKESLLKRVGSIATIPASKYRETIDWIEKHTGTA